VRVSRPGVAEPSSRSVADSADRARTGRSATRTGGRVPRCRLGCRCRAAAHRDQVPACRHSAARGPAHRAPRPPSRPGPGSSAPARRPRSRYSHGSFASGTSILTRGRANVRAVHELRDRGCQRFMRGTLTEPTRARDRFSRPRAATAHPLRARHTNCSGCAATAADVLRTKEVCGGLPGAAAYRVRRPPRARARRGGGPGQRFPPRCRRRRG
jgi:hypothetical protein